MEVEDRNGGHHGGHKVGHHGSRHGDHHGGNLNTQHKDQGQDYQDPGNGNSTGGPDGSGEQFFSKMCFSLENNLYSFIISHLINETTTTETPGGPDGPGGNSTDGSGEKILHFSFPKCVFIYKKNVSFYHLIFDE